MTYKIVLPLWMSECPVWWRNYSEAIRKEADWPSGPRSRMLSEYNAVFNDPVPLVEFPSIEFESADYALYFILKWS